MGFSAINHPQIWGTTILGNLGIDRATRWCPEKLSSVGASNSNFTMVYGRYMELLTMVYKPTNIAGGAPPDLWLSHAFSMQLLRSWPRSHAMKRGVWPNLSAWASLSTTLSHDGSMYGIYFFFLGYTIYMLYQTFGVYHIYAIPSYIFGVYPIYFDI